MNSCTCTTPFKRCILWNKCCRCSDTREVKNSKYYCQDCKKNDQYCKENSLSRLVIDVNCLSIIFAFADIRTCFCFKAGFSRSCKAKLFSPCCECSDQRSVKEKCSKIYCQSCRLYNFYWHEPLWNYISDYLNGRSSFFNVDSLFPDAFYSSTSTLVKELHKNGFREDTALNNTNCIRKFISDKFTLAYVTELDKYTNKCRVKFYNTQYRHHEAILSLNLYNFNENLSELNNFLIVKISYNFSEPVGYYPGYFTVSEVFPTKTKSIHSHPTIIDFKYYINSILSNRNELFKVDKISKTSNLNNLNTALHRKRFWESKTIILNNKYQTCYVSKKFALAYITTIYTNKDYCFLKFYDTKNLHFEAFLHISVFNFKDLLLNKRKNEFLLIKIIFVKKLQKFNVVEVTPTGIKSLHPFPKISS